MVSEVILSLLSSTGQDSDVVHLRFLPNHSLIRVWLRSLPLFFSFFSLFIHSSIEASHKNRSYWLRAPYAVSEQRISWITGPWNDCYSMIYFHSCSEERIGKEWTKNGEDERWKNLEEWIAWAEEEQKPSCNYTLVTSLIVSFFSIILSHCPCTLPLSLLLTTEVPRAESGPKKN